MPGDEVNYTDFQRIANEKLRIMLEAGRVYGPYSEEYDKAMNVVRKHMIAGLMGAELFDMIKEKGME